MSDFFFVLTTFMLYFHTIQFITQKMKTWKVEVLFWKILTSFPSPSNIFLNSEIKKKWFQKNWFQRNLPDLSRNNIYLLKPLSITHCILHKKINLFCLVKSLNHITKYSYAFNKALYTYRNSKFCFTPFIF